MNSSEKQYYIYLRATNENVPVTREQFDDFYREVNTYRRRMQRNGECQCPADRRLFCDTDCTICPFRITNTLSVDNFIDSQHSDDTCKDTIPDVSALTEDIVVDALEAKRLLERLYELMPEAVEIGKLRMTGMPDTEVAKKIGIPNTTLRSRLQKVKTVLQKEFPDFF